MKSLSKLLATLIFITLFFACSPSSSDATKMNEEMSADTTAFISSSAAVETGKDSTRKFIRTADLKFKVKNVVNATYAIENITNKIGGFVTYTNLSSEIDNTATTAVSADSSLETTYFTVVNNMTLRVPNTQLDTTLKLIATLIDYLDYRIIKADDVAFHLLANDLTQERTKKNEKRLTDAIDSKGKKLNETANAEELLLQKQEESDNAKISNLSIKDQINFSTITLLIYQRQDIKRELISNYKNIEEYTPSFGKRILGAFRSGWEILQNVIIFLAQIWGLILLFIVGLFLYKRYGNKRKK